MKNTNKFWIAYVSTYPPRECGIATFTRDLTDALDNLFAPKIDSRIIAMNENDVTKYVYPKKVIFQISQNNNSDYINIAKKINAMSKIKMVHIEHEFGIFGDNLGRNLLSFMKEVKKPIVITMHTVLPNPVEEMKKIITEINDYSRLIFVMTKMSKQILITDYNISAEKIRIVPHGIHATSYSTSDKAKKILKLENKIILSTFGLLGPGKGIEYMIEALPNIVKEYPKVTYLIIGATHPVVIKNEGEKYREKLIQKIKDLKLENHVAFYNKYLKNEELLQFLQATDIYLSLSLNPDQAVSGTLSYALGAGRPVVSTSFAQAKEDVTEEVGYLVDFKQPKQIEEAVLKLLKNPQNLEQMSENAYFRTRNMIWHNVALSYMREISTVIPNLSEKEKNVPRLKLHHVAKMTNGFGMLQFSKLTEPDPKFGYTLDDNSRALIAVTEFYKKNHSLLALKLAKIYLKFIAYIYEKEGLHNYVNDDKSFNETQNTTENLEDSYARGMYALAYVSASKEMPGEISSMALKLFKKGKQKMQKRIISPRAISFYIKALCKINEVENNPSILDEIRDHCEYLIKLHEENNAPGWQWFEDILTYSNGVIPESLLQAYKITGDQRYFNVAKITLDFLISHSFKESICIPIGQEKWYKKGSDRAYYDQQPEEVTSLVQVLKAMYEITNDKEYQSNMINAFNWFLGNNLLGQIVYDQQTGGCYDGVQEKKINLNQGAESTISYLIARLTI